MLELESLLPLAALLAIAGVHAFYWRLQIGAQGQHLIEVVDLMNLKTQDVRSPNRSFLHMGDLNFVGSHVRLEPGGQVSASRPKLLAQLMGPGKGPVDPGLHQKIGNCARLVLQTLIYEDDIIVDADTVFLSPVKVGGDLIVTGRARFDAPVTVNGYLKVTGTLQLCSGAVVKQDVVVVGKLMIGTDKAQGWIVARRVAVEGTLLLNGKIDAAEGIHF
jgi:hypothetical protein